MLLDILFTIFLVLLNGFFVAAEFAIVKVRASQIDLKVSKGSKRAKIAKHILENLDAYLSASQLGITLASLGLGWVGESIVAEIVLKAFHFFNLDIATATAHSIAIPIAFTLITVTHIVFGEQAPKTIAIKYPLEMSMFVSLPLRIFYVVFRPFIWFINSFSKLILRMMGVNSNNDQDVHSEEELKLILTESEEGGAIKPSENELIQNVFDFDDRIVKQILVPRTKMIAIDIETSNDEIIDKVVSEGYSRLPVYQENLDNIIGVIHTKDLLKVIKLNNFKGIKDIIRPAHFVPVNKRINELLREFQKMHIQMAIVTSESGGTAGLVTMEDIIEELVGEIQDEHDEEKPIVEKKSDMDFIVQAMASSNDVNELLPVPLPTNTNYETVSGFINFLFGRIPAVNEKRNFGSYEITILKRQKHSIESIQLKLVEIGKPSEE